MSTAIDDTIEMVPAPVMSTNAYQNNGLAILYAGKVFGLDNPLHNLQILEMIVESMLDDDPPSGDWTTLRYELRSIMYELLNADTSYGQEYIQALKRSLIHIRTAMNIMESGNGPLDKHHR